MLNEDCQAGMRRGAELALGTATKVDVVSIEVWGCGSAEQSSEQAKQRDRDHHFALKNQKVLQLRLVCALSIKVKRSAYAEEMQILELAGITVWFLLYDALHYAGQPSEGECEWMN